MKRLSIQIALCVFAFLLCIVSVHGQQFKWATGGGAIEDLSSEPSHEWQQTKFMCTDPNGNIYALSLVGNDAITADTFYRVRAYGSDQNVLITSYNCNGQMRWAKLIANDGSGSNPFGVISDNLGNIYVYGLFNMDGGSFYIGYDTTISPPASDYLSIALIQFDTTGNFKWVRFVGVNTFVSDVAVSSPEDPAAIDGINNIHYFCYMKSGVPLMPGDTSMYGVYDMTYNPAGTLLSTARLDMDSQWYLNGATIDPVTNKLYVSGQINQEAFGSFLTDTFYAAAFDASRNLLWQYFCGHGDDDAVDGIVMDQNKYLYFSGASQGPPWFSFHGDSVSGAGDMGIVMKTDTNGNVQWIKRFYDDATSINALFSITLLPNFKVAAIGSYAGIVTDGTATITTPPGEDQNPYLVVLDSAGDLQTIQQIYGDGFYNAGNAITSDQVGNIYIGGMVTDSIWAGVPPIPAYHSVGGNTEFFVMKYGVDCSCTSGPVASCTDTGTHTIGVTYTGTTAGLDSVVWRFGDGGTATGVTAYHTYTLAGTYRVCGTVYTTCGSDIYCTNITILCGLPPVAAFTKTGTNDLSATYTGTISTVDSVGWIFGDGFRDTGRTVTHTYTAIGIYDICAVAHSMCGNDTACHYDTVVCVAPPLASYTYTGTITVSTTYTGTTTGVDSIGWLFGDGSRGSGTTASHTYTTPGVYNACVVAHSTCGNDTACHTDTVSCVSPPVASFTDTGTINIGTTYTGTVTGVDSTVWNFGDGSGTVTGASVIHTYSAIGTYHVCVTAYTPCGNNTSCKYDTVLCITAPVASFTDTGTHTLSFAYTGTTADIDSIVWSFGDGLISTGMTSLHTYTASGTYHVCVTTYTGCGIDSVCNDISVLVPNSVSVISAQGNIKVFPNPANEELNISGLTESTSYRLLSIAGTCVLQGSLQQPSGTISMQDIVPGVYVLELTGLDGEKDIARIVKE